VRHPLKNRRPIGPHSRASAIGRLDGRTRSGRRLKEIEADLLGFAANGAGVVTAGQVYLARRAAIDLLRLEAMDAAFASGEISDASAKIAHALRNSTRLDLKALRCPEFQASPPQPQPKPARQPQPKAAKPAAAGPFDETIADLDRLLPSIDDAHRLAVELGRRGLDRVAPPGGTSGGRRP
jgi:hypothetical protein